MAKRSKKSSLYAPDYIPPSMRKPGKTVGAVTKDVKFGSLGNGNMAEDSGAAGKPFKPGRLSANATLKVKTKKAPQVNDTSRPDFRRGKNALRTKGKTMKKRLGLPNY